MDIQNGIMMLKKEKSLILSNQNAAGSLYEEQNLPFISPPITYEMLEMSEKIDAIVCRDMSENKKIWDTLSIKEMMKRIDQLREQAEIEMLRKKG